MDVLILLSTNHTVSQKVSMVDAPWDMTCGVKRKPQLDASSLFYDTVLRFHFTGVPPRRPVENVPAVLKIPLDIFK